MKKYPTYLKTRTLSLALALGFTLFSSSAFAVFPGLMPKTYQPKKIVLAACMPLIGDSIVYLYPQLEALHDLYPEAEITLLSSVRFIKDQSWLKVISPKKINFEEMIEKDFDSNTLLVSSKEDLKFLPDLCEGVDPSLPRTTSTERGEANYQRLMNAAAQKKSAVLQNTVSFFDAREEFKFTRSGRTRTFKPADTDGEVTNGNSYVRSQNLVEFLYGIRRPWGVSPHLFIDDSERALFEEFHANSFAKKDAPYAILNFGIGSQGLRKLIVVTAFGPKYFEEMAELTLKRNLNLYLVPFEAVLAPYFKDSIERLMQKYAGRIRFLDESHKETWNPAIENASAVLSYDTGFTHVANASLPEKRVLTFNVRSRVESFQTPRVQQFMKDLFPESFYEKVQSSEKLLKKVTEGGYAKAWRRPNQDYVVIEEFDQASPWAAKSEQWLTEALENCDSALHKQKLANPI